MLNITRKTLDNFIEFGVNMWFAILVPERIELL